MAQAGGLIGPTLFELDFESLRGVFGTFLEAGRARNAGAQRPVSFDIKSLAV